MGSQPQLAAIPTNFGFELSLDVIYTKGSFAQTSVAAMQLLERVRWLDPRQFEGGYADLGDIFHINIYVGFTRFTSPRL